MEQGVEKNSKQTEMYAEMSKKRNEKEEEHISLIQKIEEKDKRLQLAMEKASL